MNEEYPADGGWPWPELPIWDLEPYDRGLFTLSTLGEGHDLHGAWAGAADALSRFLGVAKRLVQIRESGRRIPVLCHLTGDDLTRVAEFIALVGAWRASGGEVTPEIQALARRFIDAATGARGRVPRGEPFRLG